MKIYLLRHGQADNNFQNDAQRQLTPRGIADVKALAKQLASEEVKIDRAFVSPYLRTQQTYQYLSEGLSLACAKNDCDALLSEASPAESLAFFESTLAKLNTDASLESILLVTHQPLVSGLIALLLDGSVRAAYDYPMMPASFAELDADDVLAGCARLKRLLSPPYGLE